MDPPEVVVVDDAPSCSDPSVKRKALDEELSDGQDLDLLPDSHHISLLADPCAPSRVVLYHGVTGETVPLVGGPFEKCDVDGFSLILDDSVGSGANDRWAYDILDGSIYSRRSVEDPSVVEEVLVRTQMGCVMVLNLEEVRLASSQYRLHIQHLTVATQFSHMVGELDLSLIHI